jgi:segregation and condensation protein B
MELSQIIPHIEALVFASDKPLINTELVELLNNALGFIEDRATIEQVDAAIEGINEKYSSEFYAFELKQSGGGWQFLTKKEYHKTVAQLNGDKFLKRLSTAALETLAIIAYKQPISKSEMEAIRGVNCDYAVQKLLEKDLVVITGRNEDAVGKPLIYYFGINSTADLPKISEVLMEELVQATIVNYQPQQEELLAENTMENSEEVIADNVAVAEETDQDVIEEATILIEEEMIINEETDFVMVETDIETTIDEVLVTGDKQEELTEDKQDKEVELSLSEKGDLTEEDKQKHNKDEQSES